MREPVLYHFYSDTQSQRLRLALGYKKINYRDRPVAWDDDEVFFELGLARKVPVLVLESGKLQTDSCEILDKIDELFPQPPFLVNNIIDQAAWKAVLSWREKIEALLSRLLAPALLNYAEIADHPHNVEAYKRQIQQQFNMSAEALTSDRYAAYEQFAQISHIHALGKHLSKNRFYMGQMSIADVLITADLYPLQCLDGVSLPIDILYYLARVEKMCEVDLQQGFRVKLS